MAGYRRYGTARYARRRPQGTPRNAIDAAFYRGVRSAQRRAPRRSPARRSYSRRRYY